MNTKIITNMIEKHLEKIGLVIVAIVLAAITYYVCSDKVDMLSEPIEINRPENSTFTAKLRITRVLHNGCAIAKVSAVNYSRLPFGTEVILMKADFVDNELFSEGQIIEFTNRRVQKIGVYKFLELENNYWRLKHRSLPVIRVFSEE